MQVQNILINHQFYKPCINHESYKTQIVIKLILTIVSNFRTHHLSNLYDFLDQFIIIKYQTRVNYHIQADSR